jgi:hypothetical protein
MIAGGLPAGASAAPDILDIAIVEVLGRPGHQGFFPIQGNPIVGGSVIVRARLAQAANNVTLNLRSSTGAPIGQLPMIRPPVDGWPPGTYFAEFIVPTIPFALSVSGTDQAGADFEITPAGAGVISPQTLALRLIPTVAELPAGIPLYFTVQATNYGATNTFDMAFTTSVAGISVVPAGTSLRLDAQETAATQFQLTLPPNVAGPFSVTLTATAASSRPAGTVNKAVMELPIATQAGGLLSAWIRANEKRDLIQLDRDNSIKIWVCDTGVNGNSIRAANLVSPIRVSALAVAPSDRKDCAASSAFELTFIATELVKALTMAGVSPQKRPQEIRVPLSASSMSGASMLGYVQLLF